MGGQVSEWAAQGGARQGGARLLLLWQQVAAQLRASQVGGGVPRRVPRLQRRTPGHQQRGRLRTALLRGAVQGGVAVPVPRLYRRPAAQQQLHGVIVAHGSRQVERCVQRGCRSMRSARSSRQQGAHHVGVPLVGGSHQGGEPKLLLCRLHRRPRAQQRLHRVQVPIGCC